MLHLMLPGARDAGVPWDIDGRLSAGVSIGATRRAARGLQEDPQPLGLSGDVPRPSEIRQLLGVQR